MPGRRRESPADVIFVVTCFSRKIVESVGGCICLFIIRSFVHRNTTVNIIYQSVYAQDSYSPFTAVDVRDISPKQSLYTIHKSLQINKYILSSSVIIIRKTSQSD